jgi:2-polyprenyl-3-methyl-5-hydroxy-6-metoxy-1,4-benzoquinol methylase
VVATQSPAGAVTERLFNSIIATFETASVSLGHRLGLYVALRDLGTATSGQLAERAGTNERYTREWLEHQAASGLIEVAIPSESGTERAYRLIPGTESLFTDRTGEQAIIHFVQSAMASILATPDVARVFRTGEGLPFGHYGEEMRVGQAMGTRWGFMTELAEVWLPALPDIHERLQSKEGARIADIGFGAGWSSVALARAYPNAFVDGFDLDEASVRMAQEIADAEGLGDRLRFRVQDAADPMLSGNYDLAVAFECLHDMAHPVGALAAMRNLVGPGGTVLIVDENVSDSFEAPASDIERVMYGYSVFHCLPGSMDGENPAGTGTVMRQATMRRYAAEAGFRSVEVLPIENDFFRFYRLNA